MAQGIKVSGNKKVQTVLDEFHELYPYLQLEIGPMSSKQLVKEGKSFERVDRSKTIASVRTKDGDKEITISGQKKIKTLESDFEDELGLAAQVCYKTKDGGYYYTSGSNDEMTLSAFNEKCKNDGCKKN